MIEHYWESLKVLVWNAVWAVNVATLSPGRAFAVRSLRVVHTLAREFVNGELNQRAASLVFTTLLSLVPLLAVSFALLKAFGVHNELESVLVGFLAPLGDKGIELSAKIMDFVDNVNGKVLGGVGVSLLLITVISLVHKVERSFNYIWRIERPRGLFERFSGYLSVVMVGPVLIFTAIGITASVMSTSLVQSLIAIEPLGTIVKWVATLIPYLLVIAAFTFIYIFIPNTRVQVRAAVVGATVAGILWESAGWAFAAFVVHSPRHAAIYSGFAVAFLSMLWLYVSWLILLVGATVAFFFQHPEYHGLPDRHITLSNRLRERMAMMVIFRIAQHHYHGKPPVPVGQLAVQFGLPIAGLAGVLKELTRQGLLVEVSGDQIAYVPARDVSTIRVADVWTAIRSAHENHWLSLKRMEVAPTVDELIADIDAAVGGVFGEATLKDMVADRPPRDDIFEAQADTEGTGPVPIEIAKKERSGHGAA